MKKAVLQAILHYMLSIFTTPKGVLQKLRDIQRQFLWSRKAEKKKWSLMAWRKICKPKILGGLGLQDPETINKACGAKLWWRWLKEPTAPWAVLWKAKYAEDWRPPDLVRLKEEIT